MKIKAFAVIDTNVLVSAAITGGPPYEIFKLIENRNVIPIFDKRILSEYYSVFHYDKFKNLAIKDMMKDVLFTIVINGICINDVEETKIAMRDRKDIPFFEVKESSFEFDTKLVTGNMKHYPDDINVVSPREMLGIINYLEKFVQVDLDYEKTIVDLINTNVSTPKYTLGDDLIEEIFDDVSKRVINKSFFQEAEQTAQQKEYEEETYNEDEWDLER